MSELTAAEFTAFILTVTWGVGIVAIAVLRDWWVQR